MSLDELIQKRDALYDSIYGRDNPPTESGGWIQWKGTNVCMDIHCKCGHDGHVDTDFFYYYKCPACGTIFAVGQNVKLIEMTTPEQIEQAIGPCLKTDSDFDEDEEENRDAWEKHNAPPTQ